MANETQDCYSLLSVRFNLQNTQRHFLVSYTIIVNGVVTYILNALLILVIIKTKQTNTPVLRVLLYLSMMDVCISLTTPIIFTMLLSLYESIRNCTIELVGDFLSVFFGHMSCILGTIIAYDTYARVRYLTKYPLVMSQRKINRLMLAACSISLFTPMLYTIGTIHRVYDILSFVVLFLDCIIGVLTIALHILTKITIRRHRKSVTPSTDRLKDVDKTITLLSKMVLLSLLCFYGFYMIACVSSLYIYKYAVTWKEKSWIEFFLFFGMMVGVTNSAMNAIIFFATNKKSQVFLKNIFQMRQKTEIKSVISNVPI